MYLYNQLCESPESLKDFRGIWIGSEPTEVSHTLYQGL